ncbi:MAG TPA: tetratricopeptide repeat protein, partial [Planctomycetota bacterium]|nr:tetratricopeptide repeat protein [Planctomycetota bacterium]
VVERGLARLAADRFADGAELARALRASGSGSSSRLAAAVLGVVVSVTAVVVSLARPAPRPPVPFVAPSVPPPPPRPLPPAPPREPVDARAFFERARARAARGETREAIDDYTRGLERTPDAEAYVARGLLHEANGELDPALEDYSAAYELDPTKNAVAVNYRGSILARKGLHEAAAAAFTAALQIDPGMKLAWLNRAVADLWLERLDLAIADSSRVVALDPDAGEGWAMRGRALFRKGDMAAAIADLEKATALVAGDAEAWMTLGAALHKTHESRRAVTALDRAVALAPTRAVAWQLRGVARSNFDLDGAIADEEKALSLDPKFGNDNLVIYFMRRADERAKAGDTPGAVADLRRFLDQARPDHPERAAVAARLEKLSAR